MRHLFALLIVALVPAVATAGVSVKRLPPTVERKTFDPANPPADMPHLEPGELAVTTSKFGCQARVSYEVVSRKPSDAGTKAVVYVSGISFTLSLDVVIWVPQGVTEKLKAHEEGHRKIAEQIYIEHASNAARAAAAPVEGHRVTGEGADAREAVSNTINTAITDVGKTYMKTSADIANDINNAYDLISEHGTNLIIEQDAIHQAFDRYQHDHPTSAPGKSAKEAIM